MNTKMIEDKLEIVLENEAMVMGTECCIYKVPTNLRRINEEAYTPQVISIGPFHHGKPELAYMETQKLAYQLQFRRRLCLTKEKMVNLWRFIERKEIDIRKCYRESTSEFDSCKFIKMILYDAIFIIEYFVRYYSSHENNPLMDNNPFFCRVRQDLLLLENQIPYFILDQLYHHSLQVSPIPGIAAAQSTSFQTIAIWFFKEAQTVGGNGIGRIYDFTSYVLDEAKEPKNVAHFTDLLRFIQIRFSPAAGVEGSDGNTGLYRSSKVHRSSSEILVCSTTKLHEAGVRFINDDHTYLLDLKFENKVLRIPHIKVNEQSESLIRNIMALEQCHYPYKPLFCTFISLLDSLINTENDVHFLALKNVIENNLGDNVAVANMVNRLCLGIATSNLDCYDQIIRDLNIYSHSFWNITMATLKSVYFSNLWRGTGTVAAIILLVLTFLQTIFSSKSCS